MYILGHMDQEIIRLFTKDYYYYYILYIQMDTSKENKCNRMCFSKSKMQNDVGISIVGP